MNREALSDKRLAAWLFAAITPPAIQLIGGASWLWTLAVTAGCLFACLLCLGWGKQPRGRIVSILYWLTTLCLMGTLAGETMNSWQTGAHVAVPLVLLALAASSALKGPSAAARVGCVLFWFVLGIYLLVFGAGIREVRPMWLRPAKGTEPWLIIPLLLTPVGVIPLLKEKERRITGLPLIGIFVLLASVITLGVLSPMVAANTDNAFYEMTRSLSILETARRFEAVISAAMTVGWFALMSLYLTLCGHWAEEIKPGGRKTGIVLGAVVSGVLTLCDLHIDGRILAVWTTVFWVATPLITQGIDKQKKS